MRRLLVTFPVYEFESSTEPGSAILRCCSASMLIDALDRCEVCLHGRDVRAATLQAADSGLDFRLVGDDDAVRCRWKPR